AMSRRGIGLAVVTLALGYAVAAALFWALLNVPESSVAALGLSAALAAATLMAAGMATAAAAALGDGASGGGALRRSLAALPACLVGLIVFGALWWMTGAIDRWWSGHRGEVDATFIRYVNIARTNRLHQAVFWTTWIVRWIVGLSVVAALVATAT